MAKEIADKLERDLQEQQQKELMQSELIAKQMQVSTLYILPISYRLSDIFDCRKSMLICRPYRRQSHGTRVVRRPVPPKQVYTCNSSSRHNRHSRHSSNISQSRAPHSRLDITVSCSSSSSNRCSCSSNTSHKQTTM